MASNKLIKKQLDNGLVVLVKELPGAAVATFSAWYRVGSRHEQPGYTGLAHCLEHLAAGVKFKRRPCEEWIARQGGYSNAMTSFDHTTYYATLPADRIDIAWQLEAGRMRGFRLPAALVEKERGVVISERQWSENSPQFNLYELVASTVFLRHPYRRHPIGYLDDLLRIAPGPVTDFYRRYYVPNNAFVVAAGPQRAQDVLKQLRPIFEPIPPGRPPAPLDWVEPPQSGQRRCVLEKEGNTAYLEMAYRIPAASHPDFMPLIILGAILTGISSFELMSWGTSNASSRLYKALVDTALATSVGSSLLLTPDPFCYMISVTVRTGRSLAEVEAALDAELARLVEQAVSEAEIAKAIQQAKAAFAFGAESVTQHGFWYGFSEMFADHTWFETCLDRLAAVSPDDVQRVARAYLAPSQRTVGWYVPQG